MSNNIYPDLSGTRFDVKYSRRIILASDILASRALRNGVDNSLPDRNEPRIMPELAEVPVLSPSDVELEVIPAGSNIGNIIDGNPIATVPQLTFYNVRVYRNNIPQQTGQEYRWNRGTGELNTVINPVEGEIFTLQPYTGMPDQEIYNPALTGGNINNFQVDNSIVFLTNFVNVRVRIRRNNILQSFIRDFNWDSAQAKLTWLNVPPQLDEEFIIDGY